MDKKDIVILKKILEEIRYLDNLVKTMSVYEEFDAEEKTKRATAMTLINIGELANHLSKEFQKSQTDFPIRGAVDLRNVAAHGYHILRFKDIWHTVQTSIPDLKVKIEKLLKHL